MSKKHLFQVAISFVIGITSPALSGLFGASAIFAVSLAVCRVVGFVQNLPLYKRIASLAGNKKYITPFPVCNVINARLHLENKLSIQEFTIHPVGVSLFINASMINWKIYHYVMVVIGVDAAASEFYGQNLLPKVLRRCSQGSQQVSAMAVHSKSQEMLSRIFTSHL